MPDNPRQRVLTYQIEITVTEDRHHKLREVRMDRFHAAFVESLEAALATWLPGKVKEATLRRIWDYRWRDDTEPIKVI